MKEKEAVVKALITLFERQKSLEATRAEIQKDNDPQRTESERLFPIEFKRGSLMNPTNYVEIFQKLVVLALDYQFKYENPEEYEPAFYAVLMYVKWARPELQKLAELEFARIIENPALGADELVAYCMRDLKFEIVRENVLRLIEAIATRDANIQLGQAFQNQRLLADILRAYEPEWDGDHLYSYHRAKASFR